MEGVFGSFCVKNVILNIVLLYILKYNGILKIVRYDILFIFLIRVFFKKVIKSFFSYFFLNVRYK